MRYIIVGAGAVGASLAAQFEAAGVDYTLLARGGQLAHLRAHGLRYRRPEGETTVALTLTDEAGLRLRADDVILLCVKTQDVEATGRTLARLPVERGAADGGASDGVEEGADLPIVALQNGLAAERILARRFARVYSASVRTPAIYTRTGEVRVLATPQFASFTVGRHPAGTDAVSGRLVADLARAGALAEERGDITRWKAEKLVHNMRNALELFAGDEAERERAGAAVASEAERALRAAGHDLPRPGERRVSLADWRVLEDPDDPAGHSTWQSFVRGAPSEVDFLNGEIVRLGHLHGVPTPWNRAVARLSDRLAARGGKPGDMALDELASLAERKG